VWPGVVAVMVALVLGQAAARGFDLGPDLGHEGNESLACSYAVLVLGFRLSRVPCGLEAVLVTAPALSLAG
jgi:hypothetical protein